ncbi:N/A [soil metagenome]
MNHAETFEILIGQAREQRDRAARQLADAELWRRDSASKHELLVQYRQDYFTRLQSGFSSVDAAPALARFGAFIVKLEEAIAQQLADLRLREQSADAARAHLSVCEKKLRSLEVYVQRQQEALLLKARQREQKDTDEYAARAARRASTAGSAA